ncbi:MAG: helix-turn-helix transcriptional regulator [Chloroflexi bacterium]|nr:helix-turn-helix transcriptional regulator [Chloroflexota bacterium]
MRNPGYGHPLRPEYVLTPAGESVGRLCVELAAVVRSEGLLKVALKKWPMIVLAAVGRGAHRFGEVKAMLPGVSARSLALALKDLESEGLLERRISAGYPPAPAYSLTAKAQRIFPVLDRFVAACEALPLGDGQ